MIIGITGGFGTGKTTVAKFFKELGAKVIDADEIAHKSIRPGTSVYKKIVQSFGREILSKGGKIDHEKMANLVFRNKDLLKRLCNIIHPEVIKRIRFQVEKFEQKDREIIVIDAPLLIEAGLHNFVDRLLVVKTTRYKQIERLRKKGFADYQIAQRIKAQMPLKDKLRIADFAVDNEGSLGETKRQVKEIFKKLR